MSADPRIPVTLHGATCRCGHTTVFTAPSNHRLSVDLVGTATNRLLYLSGWAETTPGKWVCWVCSRAAPALRHSADYVQDQARQIEHNLSSADVAAIDHARAGRREWKR